ncbi:MAG: hypothetical protein Q8N31_10735 [Reyranella sp.]|nr:hypothetical protein [Reyranella sp.]MDP3160483.1 hypothetical protein [Reyranella sp.]
MTTNKAYWVEKMNVARKAWATLRPEDRLTGKRATRSQFFFFSDRTLVRGVKYRMTLDGLAGANDWTLTACLAFHDVGPRALEATVTGDDISALALFEVNVLAAVNCLDGRRIAWALPALSFDAPDDKIAGHLAAYSRDIDRLSASAGGYDVEAFRTLALWCMRHRSDVGFSSRIGPIFAALEYGDRALAVEFLNEAEEEWEETLRREPHRELVHTLYARARELHARLRRLMDLPARD